MSQPSMNELLNEDTPAQADIRAKMPEPAEPETGVTPKEPEAAPEAPAEPPSALPKEVYEPLRAVRDENKSLKEQLEQRRREITAKPKEPEAPPPTIWEDEQAALAYTQQQAVAQSLAGSAYQTKLFTSEFHARKNIEGFNEVWEPLNQWLSQNPTVAQQAATDYDPWGFAYRAYKNQQTMQELGATDIEQLKAKIRADLEAEMAASRPPVIPPSLSTQRSVSSRNGPAWSGPPSMKDLLA